jgi:hypothetical protein
MCRLRTLGSSGTHRQKNPNPNGPTHTRRRLNVLLVAVATDTVTTTLTNPLQSRLHTYDLRPHASTLAFGG